MIMKELSVAEYAELKGISKVAVYAQIKKGKLKYKTIGTLKVVLVED